MDTVANTYEYLLHGYDPTSFITLANITSYILVFLLIILSTCNREWFYDDNRDVAIYKDTKFLNAVVLAFIIASISQYANAMATRYYLSQNIDFAFKSLPKGEILLGITLFPVVILFLAYVLITHSVLTRDIKFRKPQDAMTEDIGVYIATNLLCLIVQLFRTYCTKRFPTTRY